MGLAARREVIRRVVDCVYVGPGRFGYDDRVWVCPTGTAPPPPLPSGRKRRNAVRRVHPRRDWISAGYDTARGRTWTTARIERELRALIAGQALFPRPEAFQAAGRSRLYRQMLLSGGAEYWAIRLRVARTGRMYWTDDRIRRALEVYLVDKSTWPTSGQFRADGLMTLSYAVSRSGGVRRWAPELGVPRANHDIGGRTYWTEEHLRSELRFLCAGRTSFPTTAEFRSMGRGGMLRAMQMRGGVARWADELGLPARRR
jgi:hypothetical protein